jgi:hypothetical protein
MIAVFPFIYIKGGNSVRGMVVTSKLKQSRFLMKNISLFIWTPRLNFLGLISPVNESATESALVDLGFLIRRFFIK